MSLPAIRDRALEVALSQVGVKEEGGRNRGVQVERYLDTVNLGPGHPWCCAFVVWCYVQAVKQVGMGRELPLRRTGKCARLWAKAPALWRSDQPTVGAVFIHLTDPDDAESDGHTGIVTEVGDQTIRTIEGNSNKQGSRLGDQVVTQLRPRQYVNAGYIDIGREGPTEETRVA